MKIMINTCCGGFEFSDLVMKKYAKKHPKISYSQLFKIKNDIVEPFMVNNRRTDPELISIVEEFGAAASGPYACIDVVGIPDEATDWIIKKYDDGKEELIYVVDGKLICKS